jgi:AcrR family transcriptional regulator
VPAPSKRPAIPTKRARRTPEEARTLILDAADRVFGRHLPDAVGLKEIGKEAGVSHALVTHYFKTYAGLVEAALERRFARLRLSLVNQLFVVLDAKAGVAEMLAEYRAAIALDAADPVTVRLAAWAMMSGRTVEADFFASRVQGLRLLADALESRRGDVPREDLEFCLLASFALSVVWTVGGPVLAGALGKSSQGSDLRFETRVTRMIDGYLRDAAKSRDVVP